MLLGLDPQTLIIRLLVLLLAVTVLEFAHNYVGYKMGDPVPKQLGKLTLNPMVHINWMGWLMFALIGFGILGSAPISADRMRNPRWGYLAAVAAGPLSNLLLAIIGGVIFQLFFGLTTAYDNPLIFNIFYQFVLWNVLLFVFNLIPLFPLDGWHILLSILPNELAWRWWDYKTQSYYVFLGLIFYSLAVGYLRISFLPDLLGLLISQPTGAISRLLLGF
ncbi:hypothetical protein MASR2M15_08250 [Anaerolineales bacterium]